MYKIKPIPTDKNILKKYVEFFSCCFPNQKKNTIEYLDWLYLKNPNGKVIGYDAWYEDKLVAHYAAIPCETFLGNDSEKTLLSLNTSTHPDHQRKGLFLDLANKTYRKGELRGFKNVIGVANQKATPGRLKYLNFKLLGPLSVEIGLSTLNLKTSHLIDCMPFRVNWNKKSLAWRLNCPQRKVFLRNCGIRQVGTSNRMLGVFIPYFESPFIPLVKKPNSFHYVNSIGIKVFIGLLPKKTQGTNLYLKVPEMFKPAPLNLVFKRLVNDNVFPEKDNIFFNFLDFDIF